MSTLAGNSIERAVVHRPRQGVWSGTVKLVNPVALVGTVVLTIEDLTLTGTVVRGGVDKAEASSDYLITGGAGGWRQDIGAKSYRNDLGVKLSTVLGDAAREAGERLELAADRIVGSAYVRRAGPAWNVLVGPWWMDDTGVTQVRPRPSLKVISSYRVLRQVLSLAMREIATETPAAFAPGAIFYEAPIEQVTIHVDHASLRLTVRS